MDRYKHIAVALGLGALLTLLFTYQNKETIVIREQVHVAQPASADFFAKNEARKIAFELLTPKNFKCIDYIFTHESNWRSKAKNHGSTAKGIGQLLDETYRNLGMKHSTDPTAQVVVALAYIGRKYGSGGPCAAKAHWVKYNWY